jgi:nucleoside-diphosphate-sugar epimerase
MENLNINLSVKDLTEMVKETIGKSIEKSLNDNKEQIEKSIDGYFKKAFLNNKESQFESALDWAVETAFRIGLEKAMGELNFKELIAEKAKEILSDNNFIKELAEQKVRRSLGL